MSQETKPDVSEGGVAGIESEGLVDQEGQYCVEGPEHTQILQSVE